MLLDLVIEVVNQKGRAFCQQMQTSDWFIIYLSAGKAKEREREKGELVFSARV